MSPGAVDEMLKLQIKMADMIASDRQASQNRTHHDRSEAQVNDKLNAVSGLEFKQTLPILKDSETDFAKQWMNVQSILDGHSYGRQSVRPIDTLTSFRKTLMPGSTRLLIYDIMSRRARCAGKLPLGAQEPMDKIV